MKTMVAAVACFVLIFACVSVSSAQVLTTWEVSGLYSLYQEPVTQLSFQVNFGVSAFQVFGSAKMGCCTFPLYGSGFIDAENHLNIDFTLTGNTLGITWDLNNPTTAAEIFMYSPDGRYTGTGTAVLVKVEQ